MMGIRIDGNEDIGSSYNRKTDNEVTVSFDKILNAEKKEALEREKEIIGKKIEHSSSVTLFNKILDVDGSKGRDMYYKDNGKIDVMRMLNEYGENLNTKKLNELVGSINGLYKEGLIDEEDYFSALKWIRTKIQEKSVEININKEKFKVIESLDKE